MGGIGWKIWAVIGVFAAALLVTVLVTGTFNEGEEQAPARPTDLSARPSEISLDVDPEFEPGRLVAAQSGCLACHQFGHGGNEVGPELTTIGAKLSANRIRSALVSPEGIMPSYENLPSAELDSLVAFLASLR